MAHQQDVLMGGVEKRPTSPGVQLGQVPALTSQAREAHQYWEQETFPTKQTDRPSNTQIGPGKRTKRAWRCLEIFLLTS